MERKNIGLRVSEAFLAQVDELRGGVPREAWIRQILVAEVDRLLRGARVVVADAEPARGRGPIEEPGGVFEEPELDKWGNPAGTAYDETDPRSWT